MTQIDAAWGAGPTPGYEQLAARFRPLFASLREGAIERERQRRLPIDELAQLKTSGFTAVRVPQAYGGSGISLPELTNLLIELGEADSNLVQALRGHFGFTESILNSRDEARARAMAGAPGTRRNRWPGDRRSRPGTSGAAGLAVVPGRRAMAHRRHQVLHHRLPVQRLDRCDCQ